MQTGGEKHVRRSHADIRLTGRRHQRRQFSLQEPAGWTISKGEAEQHNIVCFNFRLDGEASSDETLSPTQTGCEKNVAPVDYSGALDGLRRRGAIVVGKRSKRF